MSSIVVGSRGRMSMQFYKDKVPFDPQQVFFAYTFYPATFGVPDKSWNGQFGMDAELVRTGVGAYYVEYLFDQVGSMKFTWRSTAWGEELNMEEITDVKPRTIVER